MRVPPAARTDGFVPMCHEVRAHLHADGGKCLCQSVTRAGGVSPSGRIERALLGRRLRIAFVTLDERDGQEGEVARGRAVARDAT
jgi:hypothetical protein